MPQADFPVSVVVPLFNKAPYVERCLNSIRRQTARNFEVVVVDDGSTDNGPAICKGWLTNRDRLIRQPNAGEGAARNRGVAESKSEFIAFLDADDEWDETFLQETEAAYGLCPEAALVATGYRVIDASTRTTEICLCDNEDPKSGSPFLVHDFFEKPIAPSYLSASSVVCRRAALTSVGGFAEGRVRGADGDLWVRMALAGHAIACIPKVLATYYRDIPNSALRVHSQLAEEFPVIRTLRAALGGGGDAGTAEVLSSYLARWEAAFLRELTLNGQRKAVAKYLREHMPELSPEVRLLAWFALAVPGPAARFAFRYYGSRYGLALRSSLGLLRGLRVCSMPSRVKLNATPGNRSPRRNRAPEEA